MKVFNRLNCFFVLLFCSFVLFAQNEDLSEDVLVGLHKVEQGETLYRISRNFYLTEKDIMEVNVGLTAENLKAGQIIKIPITTRNKESFKTTQTDNVTKVQNNTLALQSCLVFP